MQTCETKVNILEGVLLEKKKQYTSAKEKRDDLCGKISTLSSSISLAKNCIVDALEKKTYLEELVTHGLQFVFGKPYKFYFRAIYEGDALKGLVPTINLDNFTGDADDAFGGAVQTITSLCLRIAVLLLINSTERLLILDEPFANINLSLQERFKEFIENICDETDFQIIMVTHTSIPLGTVYEVTKNKGISTVKRYENTSSH